MDHYHHYIDGQWVAPAGGGHIDSIDPYTGQPWATIARGTPADVDAAVQAADRALTGPWGQMTATARGAMLWRMGDVLLSNVDHLAMLESHDNGRILSDMKGIITYLAEFFRYFGGLADKIEGTVPPVEKPGYFNYTRHEPYGVVAALTPWNSPLLLTVWKLAPGLAAGNTFVLKPHEFASVGVLTLAALMTEAGLPPGVVNVVTGDGAGVGAPLVAHPKVRKVAFTGGDVAGRAIAQSAAADFKPVTLELGGKSPNIIFADANLDNAAKGTVMGMYTTNGQACVACSRVLVQDSVYDEFMERLVALTRTAQLGDPTDPATEMGPLISQAHFDRVLGYVTEATALGATCTLGGVRSTRPGCENGYFLEPTIIGGVSNTMRIAQEEIFGPVMTVLRFKDEDEAVQIANDTKFGLGAGVWTEDMRRAFRMSNRLQAGSVYVNSYRVVSFMSPFGGYKHSGIGRENGQDAICEYMQTKSVWIGLAETAPAPFGKPYG
jgi:(Z)-2-((N-methylformamido)methylene)-5-hydroxybutyrolactone dehydrogenase